MKTQLIEVQSASVHPAKSLKGHIIAGIFTSFYFIIIPLFGNAQQAITGVVTDYNGYWKSSTTNLNPIKPVNSHNLLAFTFNKTQYSTGVSDATLLSHGDIFVPGDFWALPVEGYSGTITSNTKIGLGEMYDGVHNGPSLIPPVNNIPRYLTDGIKGLDIGTCVANLPVGTLTFQISNINPLNIGDGIPDILVTQVADPSNAYDAYSFVDVNGAIVGQSKNVVFPTITPVATWTGDFYDALLSPMNLLSGFTNTDRPMRLWAADLSDFGITAANYSSIRKFKINLSGDSDVAFVAYNNKTFNISLVLPITLGDLNVKEDNGAAKLEWSTETEINSDYFVVEKSQSSSSYTAIDTIKAAGNSTNVRSYSIIDKNLSTGTSNYRLKMVDKDGSAVYSKVVQLRVAETSSLKLTLFPNPAKDNLTITHSFKAGESIIIYNASGRIIKQQVISAASSNQTMAVNNFTKGVYHLVVEGTNGKFSQSFLVQ